jgi:hypothetical protein
LSIDILDTAIKAIELGSSSRVLSILSQHLAGKSEGEVMNFAPAVLRRMKMIKVEMGKYRMGQSRQHQIVKVLPVPSKEIIKHLLSCINGKILNLGVCF